jgi:hypothetical protein
MQAIIDLGGTMDPVTQLTQLRQYLEEQTGSSISNLHVSTACVLYDVSKYLGLERDETKEVLGDEAYAMITQGHILHTNGQPCPFGARCSLTECLMEACERFGDRWAFVEAFNCKRDGDARLADAAASEGSVG